MRSDVGWRFQVMPASNTVALNFFDLSVGGRHYWRSRVMPTVHDDRVRLRSASEWLDPLERELADIEPHPGEGLSPLGYCAVRSGVLRERLGVCRFDGDGAGI